MFDDVG